MLNFHKILYGPHGQADFLSELDISDAEQKRLAAAREQIRAHLKSSFASWQGLVNRQHMLVAAARSSGLPDPALRPKFRMQGSRSYHTLNAPAWHPPQQIDYDDGMYLPVSFLSNTGSPIIASEAYFSLVERALVPLCQANGWKIEQKPTCVRVKLDDKAHIDLPLYAIPDEEFEELVEKAYAMDSAARTMSANAVDLAELLYQRLPTDEIRLAHREDGWIKSDPRLIEDWFHAAIETHGQQLRRVCRYLKAWRDHQWPKSALTSITLMKCVIDAFDNLNGSIDDKRDDQALFEVTRQLDGFFAGDIENPVIDGVLNDKWNDDDRTKFRQAARDFHRRVANALSGTDDRKVALAELTKAFGERIPQNIDLIVATAAATVKSFELTKMPAPHVVPHTSG